MLSKLILKSCKVVSNQPNLIKTIRSLTYVSHEYDIHSKDPAPFFYSKDVQELLTYLTQIDPQKVFRRRLFENEHLRNPVYKFMTDEELQLAKDQANKKLKNLLKMPPVLKIHEHTEEILSNDPGLKSYDTSKYVIIDTTYTKNNLNRPILVRDTDGVLKSADRATRHLMNQIYFPLEGRQLETPLMFSNEEFFYDVLNREEYEFMLSRACIQFEPDDPEYQKVTSITYQVVNDKLHFDKLTSTRYFGPMAFFLAWFQKIDNLLLNYINSNKISEANGFIWLADKLKCDSANDLIIERNLWKNTKDNLDKIYQYIESKLPDSSRRNDLELAIESYRERRAKELDFNKELLKAHGVN